LPASRLRCSSMSLATARAMSLVLIM
jgi:hypothetical protein